MINLDMFRHGIRRIYNQMRERAIILVYHRIAEHVLDPQFLCVSPSHFNEHLDCLRRDYSVVSLSSLRRSLFNRQLPRKTVVLTFDDGYVDNLWNAKPLLERYDIPATMFVTSGYVWQKRELLSDELERIILQQETLPDMLILNISGKVCSWRTGGYPAQRGAWNIGMKYDPTPRHRCYRDLHTLLRPLNETNRKAVLLKLVQWAGCSNQPRLDHCVMEKNELRALSEGGLIEIGAHSVSHLMLAVQPVSFQQEEINGSKRQLEDVLGRPVTSFAYPYGGPNDVSESTIRLVQQAGFESACIAGGIPTLVNLRSNFFTLPRYSVRDLNGDEFAKRLRMAFSIYGTSIFRLGAKLRQIQNWTETRLQKRFSKNK